MFRSRPPGSVGLPVASPLATAERTMPDADRGCDRGRGAGRGRRAAPDRDGSRKKPAPRPPDRWAPPPEPSASLTPSMTDPNFAVGINRVVVTPRKRDTGLPLKKTGAADEALGCQGTRLRGRSEEHT